MNFAAPIWLVALPAIAGLAFLDLRSRFGAALQHWPLITRLWASASGFRPAPADSHLPRRIALWLGLALCAFALARPRWGSNEIKIFGQAREVLIALDLSRSMTAKDVPPSRLERAKVLVSALLGSLRGERVGLIVFAGTAFLQSPLSPDYEILREFLPGLDPAYLPQAGTDYDQLLQTALDAFGEGAEADRFLVVLSDGESHTESWRRHLQSLKARNVRAITLGVGTAKGSLIPLPDEGFLKDERGAAVLSKLNSSTLEELAGSTGGAYRDASGWVDIAALIQATVAQGARGNFEDKVQRLYIERFQWFLAPGLLLLLLSLWREFPSVPRIRPTPRQASAPAEARLTPPPQIRRPRGRTALALFLLIASLSTHGHRTIAQTAPPPQPAQSAPPAPPDAASRLKEILRATSGKTAPPASDFAGIARATVDTAIDPAAFKDEPATRRPTILDGIDAVDAGQRIDPKAAPWDELRQQLKSLLEEKPQQQQDQQKQDQEQDKQEQDKGSGSRQDQQSQNEKSDNPQQQQQQSAKDKQQSDGNQQQQGDQTQQDAQPKDKPNDPSQSLSGLTNKADQAQQPEPDPSKTQRVGGQPTESDLEAKENPELAEALRRYERARDLDSPARLAYILDQMDGKHEEQPKKGKDW
ncbi:MAG: VWA domain-containing protein [Verrucomicrobiae bacterium]|nr:VWA domain-containing protein [Verrucomicrobiae bacterium]